MYFLLSFYQSVFTRRMIVRVGFSFIFQLADCRCIRLHTCENCSSLHMLTAAGTQMDCRHFHDAGDTTLPEQRKEYRQEDKSRLGNPCVEEMRICGSNESRQRGHDQNNSKHSSHGLADPTSTPNS